MMRFHFLDSFISFVLMRRNHYILIAITSNYANRLEEIAAPVRQESDWEWGLDRTYYVYFYLLPVIKIIICSL